MPPAPGEIAGLAVTRAVPSLHRQDAETVAHAHAVHVDGLRERRFAWRRALIVQVKRNIVAQQMRAEGLCSLERGDSRIRLRAHDE